MKINLTCIWNFCEFHVTHVVLMYFFSFLRDFLKILLQLHIRRICRVRGVNCILFVGYYFKKTYNLVIRHGYFCLRILRMNIIMVSILWFAFEVILEFLESLRFWMTFETLPWLIFSWEFTRWRILWDSIVLTNFSFTFRTLPNIFLDGFRFCETRGTSRIFRWSVYYVSPEGIWGFPKKP